MRIIKRELAFEGDHLRLVNKFFQTATGEEGIWETVERKNTYSRGAVVVIALTQNQELILERNWRAPIESDIIQFPAGLTDVAGESEEEAAKRELLEETGYFARELIPVMVSPLSPTLTPTEGSHFLARDVEYVGRQRQDTAERIEVLKVPISKLTRFLLNPPENTMLDLRVPGILWILEKKKLIKPQ